MKRAAKDYLSSLYKYENSADKMPSKKVRKFKRKERQNAKKEIAKELKKL